MVHRGLAQVFDETNTDWNSNTVAMIEVPTHDYIENTIHSMQAAFDLGASAVELDIKLSKDGKLAVFHDSTLLYRCGVDGEIQEKLLISRQIPFLFPYSMLCHYSVV